MVTDIKELTIKLMVANNKIQNLMEQVIEVRKLEKKVEFLLRQELKISDELADNLRLELLCKEAYDAANFNKEKVCASK